MAQINGYIIPNQRIGAGSYWVGLNTYRAALPRIRLPHFTARGQLAGRIALTIAQPASGYIIPNYYADLYHRVMVIPHFIHAGAVSTAQRYIVQVWNAYKHSARLQSVTINGGEGITLAGPTTPNTFNSLALKKWQITVSATGPAVIDCVITWHFAGLPSVSLRITGSRATNWLFMPDWSDDVTETLQFLTTVHQSLTGAEQRIARRLSPRRTFEFNVRLDGVERQRFDNMLYAYGARVWVLPIVTDRVTLLQPVQQGTTVLPVDTVGRGFYVGGQALLIDRHLHAEAVDIVEMSSAELILKRPVQGNYDRQTWVYPTRSAVLTDMPQITRLSDGVSHVQVRLQVNEHNACSDSVDYLPLYRNKPVLEPTTEWSEDVTAQYARLMQTLDNETGLPYYLDTAQKAFQVTAHRFVLSNRMEQQKLRQLLYYLRGRQRAVWVATGATDMTPVSGILGKSLDIAFINYTASLKNAVGRQDIRIELIDGRVIYRRIVDASIVDNNTERLALNGELITVTREEILKISYLTLSRLDSDTVTWTHKTDADGVAIVSVQFRGVRDELE